jgi:hypothetical protein
MLHSLLGVAASAARIPCLASMNILLKNMCLHAARSPNCRQERGRKNKRGRKGFLEAAMRRGGSSNRIVKKSLLAKAGRGFSLYGELIGCARRRTGCGGPAPPSVNLYLVGPTKLRMDLSLIPLHDAVVAKFVDVPGFCERL